MQKRTDKQKLYSIHEPQVEYIGKGSWNGKNDDGNDAFPEQEHRPLALDHQLLRREVNNLGMCFL